MESEPLPRKLAAILYADVAGYSRLTGEDEDTTHRRLTEYLDQITVDIERHGGRVMHYAGDAVLAMFEAAVAFNETHRLDDLTHEARLGLAEALAASGKPRDALAQLTLAIERLERRRGRLESIDLRMRFFGNRIDTIKKAETKKDRLSRIKARS